MSIRNLDYMEAAEDIAIKGGISLVDTSFSLLGVGPAVGAVVDISNAGSFDLQNFILPSLDNSLATSFGAGVGLLGLGIQGGAFTFAG